MGAKRKRKRNVIAATVAARSVPSLLVCFWSRWRSAWEGTRHPRLRLSGLGRRASRAGLLKASWAHTRRQSYSLTGPGLSDQSHRSLSRQPGLFVSRLGCLLVWRASSPVLKAGVSRSLSGNPPPSAKRCHSCARPTAGGIGVQDISARCLCTPETATAWSSALLFSGGLYVVIWATRSRRCMQGGQRARQAAESSDESKPVLYQASD